MKYLPTCYKKDGNSLLLLTLVLYTYIYSAFLKQRRKLIDTENWRRTMRSPMLRHVGCIDDVMQKGIIDTKMREKGRLSCARCSASFPTVAIIKCDNTILGITLTMCKTCHKRFHPTCDSYVTAIRPNDKFCDRCFHNEAVVVCPQCTGPSKCAQLCEVCSEFVHQDLLSSHQDHIVKMPT